MTYREEWGIFSLIEETYVHDYDFQRTFYLCMGLGKGWSVSGDVVAKLALRKRTARQLEAEWAVVEKDVMVWEQIRTGQDTDSVYPFITNDDATLCQRLNEIYLKFQFDILLPAYPKHHIWVSL